MVDLGGTNIVIDIGPDFRQQMLANNVEAIEAILITHEHNDHIIGMDDVRPFNFRFRRDMPVYCSERVQRSLKKRFAYAFEEDPYPGAPRYDLRTISSGSTFKIAGQEILPIQVMHASMPVLGFRFGALTYLTDAKTISEEALQQIIGTKVLVLNALRKEEHHSHLSLDQALEVISRVNPQHAYLIHMSHKMGLTEEINKTLPKHVSLAYDGLTIDI
jgi:phosphoribosyl 1,2-cyclic phosphate phosphodiesterase